MFQKKRKHFARIMTGILGFAIAVSIFGFYQMSEYNDSVLDIYAQQQDSYVKLVLDQINLYDDRSDDEIIRQILGSLNTSDSEYWTLTKNEQFLYVKDVIETNRYKGFANDNYYLSDSGKTFVDNLRTNRITHALIDMNGKRYVASGTEFTYMGVQYKICLLTYDKVVLDNNSFLRARITISVIIFVLVLLLLITSMTFVETINRNAGSVAQLKERIQKQNITIEELEDKIAIETSYSASDNLFHQKTLKRFLDKLESRGIAPLTLVVMRLDGELKKEQLIQQVNKKTGKKYLKFELRPDVLLLLYLGVGLEQVEEKLENQKEEGVTIMGTCCIEDNYNAYQKQYEKFKERILKDD